MIADEGMSHSNESEIKCPYCDWEDTDSWEFGGEPEEELERICGDCEKKFLATRNIEVSYSTIRMPCGEKEHDYKTKWYVLHKKEYENGKWANLEVENYQHTQTLVCSKCGGMDFIKITKEKYDATPDSEKLGGGSL